MGTCPTMKFRLLVQDTYKDYAIQTNGNMSDGNPLVQLSYNRRSHQNMYYSCKMQALFRTPASCIQQPSPKSQRLSFSFLLPFSGKACNLDQGAAGFFAPKLVALPVFPGIHWQPRLAGSQGARYMEFCSGPGLLLNWSRSRSVQE